MHDKPPLENDPSDTPTRELRIAPVMTGGTSLAVWMGGATAELYRVTRALCEAGNRQDGLGVYRELLKFTRTKASVDVITGTSAGGLNGVLLAAATTLNVGIEKYMTTRATWQDAGDLEKLLRPRTEKDPPSLLKGDEYFLRQAEDAISRFKPEGPDSSENDSSANQNPGTGDRSMVDLVTTVTTVRPVPTTRIDSFGATINEVGYAQQLRFTPAQLKPDLVADWAPKLAVAARTSASIPGVFEPSYLQIGKEDARGKDQLDFKNHASFQTSRWAVDGGVVVNLPLTEALDRIYERSSDTETRRVALYISPTPPGALPAEAEDSDTMPTLRSALSTLVAGPRAEGIAHDIDEIQRRNELVTRQIESRAAMSLVGTALEATENIFDTYKERRAVASIERMLGHALDKLDASTNRNIGSTASTLFPARMALFPSAASGIDSAESESFHYVSRRWGWGIAPVDEAVSAALGIVSRALQFENDKRRRARLLTCKNKLHVVRARVAAVRALDDRYWFHRFREMTGGEINLYELAKRYREWPYHDATDLANGVALFEEATATKASDAARAAISGATKPEELVGRHPGTRADASNDVNEVEHDQRSSEPGTPPPPDLEDARNAVFEVLRGAHFVVATQLFSVKDVLQKSSSTTTAGAATKDREARVFESEVEGVLGTAESANDVRLRLLAIHQLQSVLLGDLVSREQQVELMQLTSNAYNDLDNRTSDQKLAGPEMARLGAFLKPSWSANDWFWGRMDAAYSLVVLLFDPVQMLRENTFGDFSDWVKVDLNAPVAVQNELETLCCSYGRSSTRETSRFLAGLIQLEIARTELPEVSDAVAKTTARGGVEGDGGRFRAALRSKLSRRDLEPTEVKEIMAKMQIGTETLHDELGNNLFNRVATHTSSVAINALAGDRLGLPLVGRLLRPLRAPLQGVSAVADWMTSTTPLGRSLGALLAATSGAIIAVRLTGADVASGFLAVAVIVLSLLVVSALLRTRFWWLAASLALTSGVIGLTLVGSGMAAVVYSEEAPASRSAVTSGSTLIYDSDGVIRIEQGSGDDQRTNDVEIQAGGRAEIRNSRAQLEAGPSGTRRQAWKSWGVMQWASVLNASVLAVGLLLLIQKRWRVLSGWLVVALLVSAAHWIWPAVLTGGTDGWGKQRLVAVATTLNDYGLGIVSLLVTGWAILLALGIDVTLAATYRRKRSRDWT